MAGEWIAVDLALDQKPEVQELIDTTGEPVETVCFRLWKLWGWASMHCADGTARMTLPRLVRTCGGDEAFWLAVAAVGWLEIDETAATVAVPGWDRRFSQAAKARLQHADRAAAQNDREPDRRKRKPVACAQAQPLTAHGRSRGEEMRGEDPPPPREAAQPAASWEQLRAAWNAGATAGSRRKPWKPAGPPEGAETVLGEPGWIEAAMEAIPRLAGCRYFDTPVTMIQFTKPGFVTKVLGDQFDDPKPKPAGRSFGHEERPPAEGWKGDDAARFEATKRALAEKIRGGAA
jgi:hypothetical protein